MEGVITKFFRENTKGRNQLLGGMGTVEERGHKREETERKGNENRLGGCIKERKGKSEEGTSCLNAEDKGEE